MFRCILAKILDIADYVPEKIKSSAVVTLHQLVSYFKAEGGLQKIEQMAEECEWKGYFANVILTSNFKSA